MNDKIRLKRLKTVLDKLNNGEHVQNRNLERLLGAAAYQDFKAQEAKQISLRESLKDKPESIKEYERKLKVALFAYNKADSRRKNPEITTRLFSKAEKAFEELLEYLQEIIAADPDLRIWFDRNTEWTTESDLGLSPISVPRVVTSKSLDKQGDGLLGTLTSNRQLKISAVEQAIDRIENPVDIKQQETVLKNKLAALKNSKY